MIKNKLSLLLLICIVSLSCTGTKRNGDQTYVFGRSFEKGSAIQPRGGTTSGPAVDIVNKPSEAWKSLQEEGISGVERDRRAILAMAGDYRAEFNFIETVSFEKEYEFDRPYRSWATERIYVLEETGDFISLQHILCMFVEDNGVIKGPFVVKHWRQDWTYEPKKFHTYRGNSTWETREIPDEKREGMWLQEVFNVDDSPRYASIGSWEHTDDYSIWKGDSTYRPLPRREYSVRSDYDVIEGINRHIILPTGWVHEQLNMKVVLDNGKRDYLAREIGLNRYDRIKDFDFSSADEYWNRTSDYWSAVRKVWSSILESRQKFVFNRGYEQETLIEKHFSFAEEYSNNMTRKQLLEKARSLIMPHIDKSGGSRSSKPGY